eukprot:TRINITY_DN11033_c0_g1_i1.p1 TRINITY_DN11033_c0_g1~~TRINITY_DN11033_c0_g1_i1.p1  ORF type:complete len:461 (+),score=171.64 TRINITY_DN11033_c0_g1_i1:74-1456(+)
MLAHCLAALALCNEPGKWSNWDQLQTCRYSGFYHPDTDGTLSQIVNDARRGGRSVKVVGAGHSFSPIALLSEEAGRAEGVMVSIDALKELIYVRGSAGVARVQAGIRIKDLNEQLFAHGYALENMGAIAEQSLAGATQTGTHGTGKGIQSMSGAVLAMQILTADGHFVNVDASNKDLFEAARVGLGAFGVVVDMTVNIVPRWKLKRTVVPYDLDALRQQLPALRKQYDRMQWFYTPHTKNATLLLREDAPLNATIVPCWTEPGTPERQRATYHPVFGYVGNDGAVGPNQTCLDWSYKALTRQEDHKELYTEMEYFLPVDKEDVVIKEFLAYQASIEDTYGKLCRESTLGTCSLFTGVRYVAADDIWLSPMYGRDTAVVSFIGFGKPGQTCPPVIFAAYAEGLAGIARKHGGRPHWGKMNWATSAYLAPQYPRFDDFRKMRALQDPTGMFFNAYLERTLGS